MSTTAQYAGWHIWIEQSESSFGEMQGLDIAASIEKFANELSADLEQAFPGADIEIADSINDTTRVFAGYEPAEMAQEDDALERIREITSALYEDYDRWTVDDPNQDV